MSAVTSNRGIRNSIVSVPLHIGLFPVLDEVMIIFISYNYLFYLKKLFYKNIKQSNHKKEFFLFSFLLLFLELFLAFEFFFVSQMIVAYCN